jgi:hypothetical protein
MKAHLILLGALLIPAAAFAQPDPGRSDAPSPTLRPPTPPSAAPPEPTVVVNPTPAPAPTRYNTTEPAYQEVTDSYNAPMFTTGALVFAASYGTSVIVAAASSNDRGHDRLYVPVLGPWLALNDRGSCDILKSSCDHETTAKVLLVADGVFQAAGIIGMLDGVLQPSSHRVVTRSAKLDTKVRLRPTIVQGNPGIKVFGRF